MTISIEMKGAACQIAIEGEMTIFVAQELKLELQAPLSNSSEIEVDLSQVTEIDAAGLQIMLTAKIDSIASQSKLRFINHSPAVQEILELSDLVGFFGDPIVLESETA